MPALLLLLLAERLLLVLGQPDLLHDLDAAELKHMDLALLGLPVGPTIRERLYTLLSGPENIHHGGYPVVSVLFWMLSRVFGTSLTTLRLIPILATVASAAALAAWLRRRAGPRAVLVALALTAGAPPLFLKWTCTTRGGHVEAIVLVPVLLLLLEAGLRGGGRMPWLLAGVCGGFGIYFTYLAAVPVAVLGAGALLEYATAGRGRRPSGAGWPAIPEAQDNGWHHSRVRRVAGAALLSALGLAIGFLPWILGLTLLGLPYLEASVHQSGDPMEAANVHARAWLPTLAAAFRHLPHNLWPWTITRADAAPYASITPDVLDFTPTAFEWAVRGVITAACLLGLGAALVRRSPLMVALAVLPGLHYLAVVRLAATIAWPDVPHRYLVLVFPAMVGSAGFGVHVLHGGAGACRRRAGAAATALLLLVAAHGAILHTTWMRMPDLETLRSFDAATWHLAGVGQVRRHESAALEALLATYREPERIDLCRGLAMVYAPISDHFLIFREPGLPPYPGRLFAGDDALATTPEARRATVRGAWDGTVLRSRGQPDLVRERVCSWAPGPQFEAEVAEIRLSEGIDCE